MIDFKLLGGFGDGQTDRQTDRRTDGRTDIGGCRVAFATEKDNEQKSLNHLGVITS